MYHSVHTILSVKLSVHYRFDGELLADSFLSSLTTWMAALLQSVICIGAELKVPIHVYIT